VNIQFDEHIAPLYDEDSADMYKPEVLGPTVDFLKALAGNGPALEFAVGTGRVAIPLADSGIKVHGIDISEPMLAEMHKKPGVEKVVTTVGDIATTRIEAESLLDGRRKIEAILGILSLCLARRTGSDGTNCGNVAHGPLGRLEQGDLHRRVSVTRICVAEGAVTQCLTSRVN
jgi:hypothetical protein